MSTYTYDFDYYTLVSSLEAYDGNTSSDVLVGGVPRDSIGDSEYILLHFPVDLTSQQARIRSARLNFTWYSTLSPNYKTAYVRTCTANFNLEDLTKINFGSQQRYVTRGEWQKHSLNYYAVPGDTESLDITNQVANNISEDGYSLALSLYYMTDAIYKSVQLVLDYDVVLPSAPTLVRPLETYESAEDYITFEWQYRTESGLPQAFAVIEWRQITDSPGEWNEVYSISSDTTYSMPPNTFPSGDIEYRIKVADGVTGGTSDYSYGKFSTYARPSMPIITSIDNSALTEIKWNALEQDGYEISLVKDNAVLFSESVASIKKSYKPKMFLSGTYTFNLRVKNGHDQWSSAVQKLFTINATPPDTAKASLTAQVNRDIVEIHYTSTTSKNYLYRVVDGEETCIAILDGTSGEYVDKACVINTINEYYIRAYDGWYLDSVKVQVKPHCDGMVISTKDASINITLSTDDYMPFSRTSYKDKKLNRYLGRAYPVKEQGEFVSVTINRTCVISAKDYDRLDDMNLSDEVILYRDNKGRKIYCSMEVSQAREREMMDMFELSVEFTQVDYKEGVEINA